MLLTERVKVVLNSSESWKKWNGKHILQEQALYCNRREREGGCKWWEIFTSGKENMKEFLSDNFYFSLKQGWEIFEECEKKMNRETVDLAS